MQVLGKPRTSNPAVPMASTLDLEPEQPETGGLDDPVVPVNEFTEENCKREKLKNLRNLRSRWLHIQQDVLKRPPDSFYSQLARDSNPAFKSTIPYSTVSEPAVVCLLSSPLEAWISPPILGQLKNSSTSPSM